MSAIRRSPEDLLADGAQLMIDIVDRGLSLAIGAGESLRDHARGALTMPSLAGPSYGCEIPPPCWYPRGAGELTSHVCPGATATLRVRITNRGTSPRSLHVAGDPETKVEPSALELGPMERGVVTVSVGVPAGDATGAEHEHLVCVRGCHEHFIRWTVCVSKLGAHSCHELDVEDGPDYLHHWYDHFYCARPCPAERELPTRRRVRALG